MGTEEDFAAVWPTLAPAARRCLELAHQAWRAGGLPVGAVLTDADGAVVAEGRNRVYDAPGGTDPLQGTPLAHAELNALARARTPWDLATHTLWSSHRPCAMCTAAASFAGVGTVRYLAADPWAEAVGHRGDPAAVLNGPAEERWVAVVAGALFLADTVRVAGPGHRTVRAALATDPPTARLALDLATHPALRRLATTTPDLPTLLTHLWPRITEATTS
ncbi:nucleoside deaminase [Kitasatospora sp. NPDC097643]|uniref:nucleoside deaminase n=1 Tax=Kitasatospora sp. NPDC097643 TaxID=3157230 RepID=UPI00331B3E93